LEGFYSGALSTAFGASVGSGSFSEFSGFFSSTAPKNFLNSSLSFDSDFDD